MKLTRRRLMMLAAAGAIGGAEVTGALDADGTDGTLHGGRMALSQAFNIASGLWLGPDSAKANVDASAGDVYMASDTDVDYYYDGGWNVRSIGSSTQPVPSVTTEQVNNVKWVDDISDLQSAVTNNRVVQMAPGDYNIGTNYPIQIPDNRVLILYGCKFTATEAGTTNVGFLENSDRTNGNSDIKIYGGEYDGGSAGSGVEPTHGLRFEKVDDLTIKDTYVYNFYANGIRGTGGSDGIVENNVIDACGQGGALNMSLAQLSKGWRVAFNVSRNCAGNNGIAVGGKPGTAADQGDHTVIGNVCYNNPEYGILVERAGDGTSVTGNVCYGNSIGGFFITDNSDLITLGNNVAYSNATNYIIAATNTSVVLGDCVSRNATSRGFYSEGPDTKIAGCQSFNDGDRGIYVDGGANTTVQNCTVKGSGTKGIQIGSAADEPKVDGNTVEGCSEQGILVQANGATVDGNTARNNTFGGIRIEADDYTCAGNRSVKNTNGLEISGSDGAVVSNTILDNGTDGIVLDGCTDVTVVGNRSGNADTSDQNYGIDRSAAGVDYIIYVGNNLRGNVSAAFNGSLNTNSAEGPNIGATLSALTAADGSTVDATYGTQERDVIQNLVTRQAELEARLESLGAI